MNSRKQSSKLCFLVLRANLATVQAVVFGNEIAGFAGALADESVVDVYGTPVDRGRSRPATRKARSTL